MPATIGKLKKKILKLISKSLPGSDLRIRLLKMCQYQIGENTYIGEDLIIIDDLGNASACPLVIGKRVAISPRVTLVMHSAPNESRTRPFINEQKGFITIHDDAWIGTGAVILPNIEIGEGAIVGANAVVTQNVPPYTVVAGIPARIVKKVSVPWIAETNEKPADKAK